MTTPDADLAASALDGIRGRGYRKGTAPGLRAGQLADYAADDIPLLLKAVEAALAFHVQAVIEDVQPEPFRYCRTCSGHPAWPCPEVAAITAALAGTQRGEDGDHA